MAVNSNGLVFDSVPVGCSMDWWSNTPPDDWMILDGRALNRIEYSELFAVIGTTYGTGDGSTTFNIPDCRGLITAGYNAGSTNFGSLGKKVGAETHTLTAEQMPKHSHNYTKTTCNIVYNADMTFVNQSIGSASQSTVATTSVGGSKAHNNIQPTLVCHKIMKVK